MHISGQRQDSHSFKHWGNQLMPYAEELLSSLFLFYFKITPNASSSNKIFQNGKHKCIIKKVFVSLTDLRLNKVK